MSRKTPIHFWFDCETTGLDPQQDTVLEVAWAFTDSDLQLISPVYQRLCAITPRASSYSTRKMFPAFDPTEREHWDEPEYFASPELHQLVRDMHAGSDLIDDLLGVNPRRIIHDAAGLERVILDTYADIEDAHEAGSDLELILSGDGVSHFDCHVLNMHLPRLFPLLPDQDHPLAYYYFDVSPARRIVGKAPLEQAVRWAEATTDSPFELVACRYFPDIDMGPDDIISPPGEGPTRFLREHATAHRAADDMIVSLLDARMIRFMGTHAAGDLTSQY